MSGKHSFSLEFPRRLIGASKVFVNCRTSSEPMTANMVVTTYRLMQAFVAQKRSVCNTQYIIYTVRDICMIHVVKGANLNFNSSKQSFIEVMDFLCDTWQERHEIL